MAFGAGVENIVGLVLGRGLGLSMIGIVAGLLASVLVTRLLDVRTKVDSEIEPGGERRAVIILLVAILSLFVIRFAGASDETRWLSSLLELMGLDWLADRLRYALEGSPRSRMNLGASWAT